MLVAEDIIQEIEAGRYKPMLGGLLIKRDGKDEFVGESRLIVNPTQIAYIQSDWCTVKGVPDKVFNKVGGEHIDCPLKVGDRVFIKPSDANKVFDLHQNYQDVRFLDVIAIEEDGVTKPFNDRVMVKMTPREMQTSGGLWLPDSVEKLNMKEDMGEGVVIAIGHTVHDPDLRLNDYVYYDKFTSPRIVIGNDIYMMVRYENIIGTKLNVSSR